MSDNEEASWRDETLNTLKTKGWELKKTTMYQRLDDVFEKDPNWFDEGVWNCYICTRNDQMAIYFIIYDRSGPYENVAGPNSQDLVKDLESKG